MIFKLHTPRPPLNQFIENIVYYSGYRPPHSKEKLLPDGYIELIIDLTEVPKHVYDNLDHSEKSRYRKGWVSGIRREFITIEVGQNSSMMVVRFRPGRALPFFGFPLSELADEVVEMECIWGSRFLMVREEIVEAELPEQRLAILERHLLQIAGSRMEPNHSIDHAISLITGATGIKVAEVKERLGYSHKHLLSLFEKHVGISPKYFSRLARFQKVVQALEAEQRVNWSRIAQDCDYYDQAHLISEFKKFSGLTPTSYLSEKGEYLNYIPIQ